jgi:DNA replication and repair protein RecF
MILEDLKIENFKNYEGVKLTFTSKFNCFTGLNGSGKTNLLDAIYYLCTGKSYFNSQDSQLILNDENYFSLCGHFLKHEDNPGEKTDEVACILMRGRKKVIKKNDVQYERLVDHYGDFPAVMIAPADAGLITGGSEERRKWMDSTISMEDKQYLIYLLKYDKVLQQRNAELKRIAQEPDWGRQVLDIYNQMLIPLAEEIHLKRKEFINDFIPVFQEYYDKISQGRENVGLEYYSRMHESPIADLLEKGYKQDVILQRTNYGTHKDDLDFTIFNQSLKKFGSQGQQKTFVFALKLAQQQFIRKKTQKAPLLLLDDVGERLDEERLQKLMDLLNTDEFGQIFITDTSLPRMRNTIPDPINTSFFTVEAGKVSETL